MRYSTFKYGSGVKYGSEPVTTNLLWGFIVNWDGSGFTSESLALQGLTTSRGRDHFVNANGDGFERYSAGEAVLTLDNTGGRYSPYNTASPLYPNVAPGKFARIIVKNGSAGATYSIIRGIITDIQPIQVGLQSKVKVVVRDGLEWLRGRKAKVGVLTNHTFDNASKKILDQVRWPTEWGYNAPPGGNYTIPYSWWFNENALEALYDLQDAELGNWIVGNDGKITFFKSNYNEASDTAVSQSEILTTISIPQPWEVIRNEINVFSYPITSQAVGATLWELGSVAAIGANSTFVTDAYFKYENIQNPAGDNVTYTLTVNSAADGSGTNLSADCFVVASGGGNGATLTVYNGSATPGYITLLRATGDILYNLYPNSVQESDGPSSMAYGDAQFTLDTPWLQGVTQSSAIAVYVLSQLKDAKKFPIIQVENRTALQYTPDLYKDVLTLTISALGISAQEFRIGKISHQWLNENGQSVRTTFVLEPKLALFTP